MRFMRFVLCCLPVVLPRPEPSALRRFSSALFADLASMDGASLQAVWTANQWLLNGSGTHACRLVDLLYTSALYCSCWPCYQSCNHAHLEKHGQ